ncbi:MAG TPA: tripartite tricarboxylate transporter substrate binding protein [Burkholderiales bacterium]
MRIARLLRFAALTTLAALAGAAQAADPWPTKPIRIVIPFSAGGVQDALARSVSDELGQALGQPIIVENRVGAGGTIGTAFVAKSAPDGYTLILSAASHTINGSLYSKLPYDPIKDFTGAAYMGNSGYVLVTNAQVPAKSVPEFIAYVKANPGKFNYATAGVGSASHLSMAYFVGMAGLDMVHVPTKGTGDAMVEVLAGRSQALIGANVSILPFLKDPRVRLLGVTSEKPTAFVPGVPPIANTVRGYSFDTWFGLLAPAATPKEIVAKINTETSRLMSRPAIIERLHKQGIEEGTMSVEAFNKLLREDYDRMARVVKISGAKAD